MGALDPFVGAMAASTCVRGTALAMGKTADELTLEDWPTLQASIRRLLSPIAPESVISQIISDIEQEVR